MAEQLEHPYASRGGLKLEAALRAFNISPAQATCVDLGCSTGGFVSCWLQHGAAKVYAVDTAYGELAWALRQDERVKVMERTNALHAPVPREAEGNIQHVSLDLGWTVQAKAVPAALRWFSTEQPVSILSLVKPHYENPTKVIGKREHGKKAEVQTLSDDEAERISREAIEKGLTDWGLELSGLISSPIKGRKGGNLEFIAWLTR